MPGFEKTSQSIRYRVNDPGQYTRMRTGTLQRSPLVRVVWGVKEGSTTEVQALIFPLSAGWTMEKVRAWVSSHREQFTEFGANGFEYIKMRRKEQEDVTTYVEWLSSQKRQGEPDAGKAYAGRYRIFADGGDDQFPTATIEDVEVFDVGTWNGEKFTREQLERAVRDTNAAHHLLKPFVKVDHKSIFNKDVDGGMPKLGVMDRLRMVGSKIVTTLHRVPMALAKAISAGAYDRVSVEAFQGWRNPETGERIPLVFIATTVLGAELPAVTTLEDVPKLYRPSWEPVKTGRAPAFAMTFTQAQDDDDKDRKEQDMPFTQEDLDRAAKEAAEKAAVEAKKKFDDELKKAQDENKALKDQAKEAADRAEKAARDRVIEQGASFIEKNLTRITPAFKDHAALVFAELEDDDQKVHTFSQEVEGKDGKKITSEVKVTPRQAFIQFVEGLEERVKTKEMAHATSGGHRSIDPEHMTEDEGRSVAVEILKRHGKKTVHQSDND